MAKTELKPYIDVDIRIVADPSSKVISKYMEKEGYEHHYGSNIIISAISSAIALSRIDVSVVLAIIEAIDTPAETVYNVWEKVE